MRGSLVRLGLVLALLTPALAASAHGGSIPSYTNCNGLHYTHSDQSVIQRDPTEPRSTDCDNFRVKLYVYANMSQWWTSYTYGELAIGGGMWAYQFTPDSAYGTIKGRFGAKNGISWYTFDRNCCH